MQPIDAILFEPVGCLAEFGADEFDVMMARIFGQRVACGRSGSEAYWNFLNVMDEQFDRLTAPDRASIEEYELEAVARARVYEDVAPALAELKHLGIVSIVASSLSARAVTRFVDNCSIGGLVADAWSADAAGGVKHAPLVKAVAARALAPERVMFITDTAEGLLTAKKAGVNAVLMMNDPDEAMKLTAHDPAGGIVSLHELPDFVRFVMAQPDRQASRTR
jgi:phosphoglycolate phosphatase-like HAD superfamily hydrolase